MQRDEFGPVHCGGEAKGDECPVPERFEGRRQEVGLVRSRIRNIDWPFGQMIDCSIKQRDYVLVPCAMTVVETRETPS
jgi:hypothetical protein